MDIKITIICPKCKSKHTFDIEYFKGHVYLDTCTECLNQVKITT